MADEPMNELMANEPPYYLDIKGIEDEPPDPEGPQHEQRRWIGVEFECCGVYCRIYRNKEGTAYEGNCPKCLRAVRVRVGPGGTTHRMFRAQ